MNAQTVRTDLLTALQRVADWLNTPEVTGAWTYPQGPKWTIEQEFAHLLYSTYGLV